MVQVCSYVVSEIHFHVSTEQGQNKIAAESKGGTNCTAEIQDVSKHYDCRMGYHNTRKPAVQPLLFPMCI
jgi:hypothetical protein